MKIVFFGSSSFSVPILQALIDSRKHEVNIVSIPDRKKGRGQTQAPNEVKQFALEHHLPIFEFEKLSSPAAQETIQKLQPDFLVKGGDYRIDEIAGHDTVLQNGGIGSILNHSEHPMDFQQLGVAVAKLRELGLKSVICAKSEADARQIAFLNPDFLAIEPPELIGTGKSVSTTQPEVVKNSVAVIQQVNKKVKILCGAGISNGTDSKKAKELGTEGVLLASAFVLAQDPKAVLLDIANGLK